MLSSGTVIPCPCSQSMLRSALMGLAMIQRVLPDRRTSGSRSRARRYSRPERRLMDFDCRPFQMRTMKAESVMARSALRRASRYPGLRLRSLRAGAAGMTRRPPLRMRATAALAEPSKKSIPRMRWKLVARAGSLPVCGRVSATTRSMLSGAKAVSPMMEVVAL